MNLSLYEGKGRISPHMMPNFTWSCIVVFCALYVPGFISLKAARLSFWHALAFAPLISVVFYCVGGILFEKLEVFASAWNIGLFALVLSLIILVLSLLVRRLHPAKALPPEYAGSAFDRLVPLAYVIFGIFIGNEIYLNSLPSPDHITQTWDNVFHFGVLRSFVETGNWSPLNGCSVYLDTVGSYVAPFGVSPGYYPACWHIISSLPVSLFGASLPVAANATNFIFLALVYPLGMWVLLKEIFGNKKPLVVIGVFIAYAFGACPWVLLTHWPLFPNFISLAMVPLLCAALLCATRHRIAVNRRVCYAVIFAFGLFSEVLSQPNAVFIAAVVMAAYVVYRGSKKVADYFVGKAPSAAHLQNALLSGFVIAALIIVLWLAVFELPFMQPTVNWYWSPILSPSRAIASALSLSLGMRHSQYLLGAFVIVGAIYILVKKRNLAWLLVSYLFAVTIFVVSASFDDVWLKHFLAGFWYTDTYRTITSVGLIGIPIATAGLYACCLFILWILRKLVSVLSRRRIVTLNKPVSILVSAVVVFAACSFIYQSEPSEEKKKPLFSYLKQITGDRSAWHDGVPYEDKERKFVDEVIKFIDEGDLVLNHPYDGSMMAYGFNGLPAYYRSINGYGGLGETEDSALLRERLYMLSSDKEVQEVVERIGADYVLILENDPERMAWFYLPYPQASWTGFEMIDEDTPGFELVLTGGEEGEMKLYKIVGLQDDESLMDATAHLRKKHA